MFDDSQTKQMNGADEIVNDGTPSMGLGMNPNPTSSGPVAPPVSVPQVVLPSAPSATDTVVTSTASVPSDGDLLDIKRHALEQLSPLVHQLEQTPEEKYKTLMMMIQASDNQDLVGEAYQAAQAITDEKAKAEALLNIVNEINYFTQQKTN